MTATYANSPGIRNIDTVRFEVDDRDADAALLSDEEIQYLIDSNSHILLAAASAAEAIASKYASDAKSKKVGDLEVDYGEGQAATYESLAKALRSRAYRKAGGNIHAGGVSRSAKNTVVADRDRVPPVFTVGMDDSQGTSVRGIIEY